MLDLFCTWAQKISASLTKDEVDARLVVGADAPNRAARFDIDTPSAVARITCWESGDFNAEILDLATEQYIFTENGKFDTHTPLDGQVRAFFAALNLAPPDLAKRIKPRSKPLKPRKVGEPG